MIPVIPCYGEIELIRETVTTPKLMARLIAIAVISSAMVARRKSKFDSSS